MPMAARAVRYCPAQRLFLSASQAAERLAIYQGVGVIHQVIAPVGIAGSMGADVINTASRAAVADSRCARLPERHSRTSVTILLLKNFKDRTGGEEKT
jgi:AmiR/NasT family two-component response regulator